jgi:hypothetical protein
MPDSQLRALSEPRWISQKVPDRMMAFRDDQHLSRRVAEYGYDTTSEHVREDSLHFEQPDGQCVFVARPARRPRFQARVMRPANGPVMSIVSLPRVVATIAACVGLMTTPFFAAPAQTICRSSSSTCEHDADDKLELCTSRCARYDSACADFCDDTHDTAVRYCWITKTVCAEIERSKHTFSASTRREDNPR